MDSNPLQVLKDVLISTNTIVERNGTMTRVNSLKITPILDWVLHIYYTHFRRESPICFTIDFLIFLAVKHQGLDIDPLSAYVEEIAEIPKQTFHSISGMFF